jgi:hypothetical protein
MRRPALLALLLVALAGCGSKTAVTTTTTAAAPRAPKTVWLCFPGKQPDPCVTSLATTYVGPHGVTHVERPRLAANPPVDCFYVYPTVSNEDRGNADRAIGLRQILVAQTQAARFSQVCKVYAPVYRQITDRGLTDRSLHANPLLAYNDVLAAWRDYLAHWNHGRGVVLLGHSQGSYVLKHLLSTVIDRSPAQRRLLVSAIVLGGQVHSNDFRHIPPCASATATGCVIAYSSFGRKPPPGAMFGRSRIPGTHIVCVNPARPGATASEPVTPLFPSLLLGLTGMSGGSAVSTPWVAYPDLYTARCERSGNASWLQITRRPIPNDPRPTVRPLFGAGWGLHATDVNIALADLVNVVRSEARAYATK